MCILIQATNNLFGTQYGGWATHLRRSFPHVMRAVISNYVNRHIVCRRAICWSSYYQAQILVVIVRFLYGSVQFSVACNQGAVRIGKFITSSSMRFEESRPVTGTFNSSVSINLATRDYLTSYLMDKIRLRVDCRRQVSFYLGSF